MQTYESIRDTVDTGDIVLFSGKGGASAVIQLLTRSKWSHVGMIVRQRDWDMVLVWESVLAIGDKIYSGVRSVPLSDRIRAYDGDGIAIRRLENFDRTDQVRESLRAFRHKIAGRAYEKNVLELIRAAYDGPWGLNAEDLSSLFCSELVASALWVMGLLSDDPPPNEYTPGNFAAAGRLELLNGAVLGEEVEVTAARGSLNAAGPS